MGKAKEIQEPRMEVISTELVERDGKQYIKSVRKIDFGKDGVCTVNLYDPCCTPEAQERRRERLRQICVDLVRRGQIQP